MRLAYILIIAAGIVAATVVAIFASATPTTDYALEVDALKEEQSLFVHARVIVKNIGREPVTNMVVDYGGKQEPTIPIIQPGERMDFSPPEGIQLESVTVTADPNIRIVKEYRTPITIPGMMGS